jgi:hypothetical protein
MEAVMVVSLAGSVLAVAVPAFVRNVHASRWVEPMNGLLSIGARASSLARTRPLTDAYPESAPLTPGTVPKGESVEDPDGTWEHPTWRALQFRLDTPHYFSFAFHSDNGSQISRFEAHAEGDLDGDGQTSMFKLSGELRRDGEPVLFPMEIDREVE